MSQKNIKNLKHAELDFDDVPEVDQTLPLGEQVTQFQENTAIQKKLIAEQAKQIFWLVSELRDRESEMHVA